MELSEGIHTFEAWANDSYNNVNYTNVTFTIDSIGPTFTIIPDNASIVYGNTWAGVTFAATDISLIDNYFINDTDNFVINSSGYLNVTKQLAVGEYHVNVSVNDTFGYINSTTYNLNVSQTLSLCQVLFNESSALTYSQEFEVYTNCDSEFKLYKNGSEISNNSVQSLAAGTYNFTVIRTDNENYSNTRDEETFTINKATPILTYYLNGVTDNVTVIYPNQINASASVNHGTLAIYLNGSDVTAQNNLYQDLSVGNYVFDFNVTGNENYTDTSATLYGNVTINNSACDVLFNTSSPITYPN